MKPGSNVSSDPIYCGQVPFARSNPSQAVAWLMRLIREDDPSGWHIHFANAWTVVIANGDSVFRKALASGVCFPDGLPVVWASRLFKTGRQGALQRVRGPSFFEDSIAAGLDLGLRHYLLGSTVETLHTLQSELRRRFPGVQIAGVSSPPFRELSESDWDLEVKKIDESGAEVVWVGMGTPKQDLAAVILSDRVGLPFVCVGAAFDFTAGNVKSAPKWMQTVGLEWAYRFFQEPRRLWKRYLFGNVQFVAIVVRQGLSQTIRAPRFKSPLR